MGRFSPGVPVIPMPTRDRHTRDCRGYLAAFSATVCAQLDEIALATLDVLQQCGGIQDQMERVARLQREVNGTRHIA